jgi:SAM-dependent methyltransferase
MERHEYDTMAQVEHHHWWYVGMRQLAATFISQIPSPTRIVDAGCGTGCNLAWLSRIGIAVGFDMSSVALAYADRASQTVFQASIDAIPVAAASANLVTCFDVIYHRDVRDDAAAIHECAIIIKPGGYLLLRVPAFNWLRGYHDERVHTARRYSRAQVEALCTQAGLQMIRTSYVNYFLFPIIVLQRLLENGSGHRNDQSELTIPRLLTTLVGRTALSIEAWLLSVGVHMPYGVSLLCLAQRPLAPLQHGVHDATTVA